MSQTPGSGKPLPPEFRVPLWLRLWWWLKWPYDARQLKKAGFRRLGWKTWGT